MVVEPGGERREMFWSGTARSTGYRAWKASFPVISPYCRWAGGLVICRYILETVSCRGWTIPGRLCGQWSGRGSGMGIGWWG